MTCAPPITAHLVLHVLGHEGPEAHECEHVEDGGEVVGHIQLVGQQPHQGGPEVVLQKVASELHPKVPNHGEGPY